MTCLHNHDQVLEFLRKIFLKGFQIYQNYLCALKAQPKKKIYIYFIKYTAKLFPIVSVGIA